MRRQLTDVIVVTVFRIISTDSNYLVILFTLTTPNRYPYLEEKKLKTSSFSIYLKENVT